MEFSLGLMRCDVVETCEFYRFARSPGTDDVR